MSPHAHRQGSSRTGNYDALWHDADADDDDNSVGYCSGDGSFDTIFTMCHVMIMMGVVTMLIFN